LDMPAHVTCQEVASLFTMRASASRQCMAGCGRTAATAAHPIARA
jgi:hypothetical protein